MKNPILLLFVVGCAMLVVGIAFGFEQAQHLSQDAVYVSLLKLIIPGSTILFLTYFGYDSFVRFIQKRLM